jgi:hypothetical protein
MAASSGEMCPASQESRRSPECESPRLVSMPKDSLMDWNLKNAKCRTQLHLIRIVGAVYRQAPSLKYFIEHGI